MLWIAAPRLSTETRSAENLSKENQPQEDCDTSGKIPLSRKARLPSPIVIKDALRDAGDADDDPLLLGCGPELRRRRPVGTDYVVDAVTRVFTQDIQAAEAIEHIIAAWEPSYPEELNIPVDGGPLQSRRIIERMIAAEDSGQVNRNDSPRPDEAVRRAAAASRDRNDCRG